MRQMRRLDARVLMIGEFSGRGAPLDDVRRMFVASGMRLVTVPEVESRLAEAHRAMGAKRT